MDFLFTLTYYTPYVSGLTLYVKNLRDELIKKRHKVDILCIQHDQTPSEPNIYRARPLFKINKGFISLDWLIKLINLNKKHKTIFINLPQFEGFMAAIIFKLSGKKIISIYHCDIVVPNSAIQFFINMSTFISLLLSHQVISYTEDYATNSKMLKKFLYKVTYVYPPIKI